MLVIYVRVRRSDEKSAESTYLYMDFALYDKPMPAVLSTPNASNVCELVPFK